MVLRRLPTLAAALALACLPLGGETCAQETRPLFRGARGVVVEDLPAAGGDTHPDLFQVRRSKTRIPSGRDRVAIDLFEPAGPGPFPAIVVLHGTHGPRRGEAYYLAMSEDLARHGYVALFLRFYDRGRKNGTRGVRSQWSASIGHALDYLQTLPNVDSERLGAVGYSQGAFMALNYAPGDPRIQAISALYGGLSPGFLPVAQQHMPPVLILHGTADRIVPVRRALETTQWLREAGKPVDLVIYPTVGHGFTLHERGGWDEVAGADAWQRTLDFLDFQLKAHAWRPEVPNPATAAAADTAPPPAPEAQGATAAPLAALPPEMARFSLNLAGEEAPANPLAMPPLRMLPHLAAPRSEKGRDFVLVNPDPAEVRALAAKHAPPRKKSGKKGTGGKAAAPAVKPSAPPAAKAPGAKPADATAGEAPAAGSAKPAAKPAAKPSAKPAPPAKPPAK